MRGGDQATNQGITGMALAFFGLSPGWHCLLSLEAVQELELLHGEDDFPPLVWFLNKTGGCTER